MTTISPTSLSDRLRVLAAAALFSSGGAVIKSVSLNGWQVASFRSVIAAVTLFLLLPEARRRPNGRVLGVGAAYAATMVLFVLSNKLTTAASLGAGGSEEKTGPQGLETQGSSLKRRR